MSKFNDYLHKVNAPENASPL